MKKSFLTVVSIVLFIIVSVSITHGFAETSHEVKKINITFISRYCTETKSFKSGEKINIYEIINPGDPAKGYYFKEWRDGSVGNAKENETKAPIGEIFKVPNKDITVYAKYLRIGEDGWIQRENAYPYSSVAKLSGGSRRGSGVVIGKDYVLSAKHVLGSSSTKSVIPGFCLPSNSPNGSGTGISLLYPNKDIGVLKMTKYNNSSSLHIGDVVKPLTVKPNSISGLKLTRDGKNMTKYNTGRVIGYPTRVEQQQYVCQSWLSPYANGKSFRLEATQSHSGWGGISGGAILNSADQVMSVAASNNRASFGGVLIDDQVFQWLLEQGLRDEVSRMYFTKNMDEYDKKRRRINPEGTYISKKNGETITSEELKTVSKKILIGHTVTSWTDSLDVYSTNSNILMPIAGNTLYPETYEPNNYFIQFDKNADDARGDSKLQHLIYDERYKLEKNPFYRKGYEFKGWNTKADGTGDSYADAEEVKNLRSNQNDVVMLYAQWVLDSGLKSNKPNWVQVTDKRGTNAGWKLQVQQGAQFFTIKDGVYKELKGAQITINNGTVATKTDNKATAPTTSNKIVLIPGEKNYPGPAQDVMIAQKNQGMGTWVDSFGSATTGDKSISLTVPGVSEKIKGAKYLTELTWLLNDIPT